MKTSSLLIILGSILFLAASVGPTSNVYMVAAASERLTIIQSSRVVWAVVQAVYAAGAFLAVLGASMAALRFRQASGPVIPLASAAALLAGAGFFAAYAVFRVTNPEAWVASIPPHPLFFVYSLLTQLGLLLLGILLLRSSYPRWTGWLLTISMLLLFILTLVFRDMYPGIYYLLLLPIGIALIRRSRQSVLTPVSD